MHVGGHPWRIITPPSSFRDPQDFIREDRVPTDRRNTEMSPALRPGSVPDGVGLGETIRRRSRHVNGGCPGRTVGALQVRQRDTEPERYEVAALCNNPPSPPSISVHLVSTDTSESHVFSTSLESGGLT